VKCTFCRLLKLAAPFKGRIALAALLGFATVGSGIGLMAASAYIIAKAALQPSIAELQVAIVGVRFFGIARGVFRYLERLVSHDVNFRLLARLRVWFYTALEPLAPARLTKYRSGDILSRIVADVETLEHFYVRVLAPPLVAVLTAVLMWLFIGGYDPTLAITMLIFLALAGVGVPAIMRVLGRGPGRRLVAARAELNAALVDGVQGVAELLAFGAEERHQARVAGLSRELAALQERMARVGGLGDALSGLLMNLATLAALLVAIPLVTAGKLDGVSLAVIALAVMASFEAVIPLPLAAQYLENSLAAGRRLFEIVDAEPVVHEPLPPLPSQSWGESATVAGVPPKVGGPGGPATGSRIPPKIEGAGGAIEQPIYAGPAPLDYSLELRDLHFRYEAEEPLALDGVSFTVPQGGSLAVVGPSGAGKSTLVYLLLRFWDYEEGQISLGGYELRSYPGEDVRRLVGVVSQHTHLFNASVRDNLLLARPGAGQAEMERAARGAQLHDFIQSLPEGYATYIGEQGLKLSGGQRQRLAIARALLKDAPILILDEPTANLDPLTERQVMDSIQALMAGRTTLIITHRLAGLEAVDEIVVLRAGRIIERGAHVELWQMGGVYRRMWELQHQVL
jgi:ATP-binding cassette subfamily C protein CydC